MEIPVAFITKTQEEVAQCTGCYDDKTVCCIREPRTVELMCQQPTDIMCQKQIMTETSRAVMYGKLNRYNQEFNTVKVLNEFCTPRTLINQVPQISFNQEIFDEKKHWFTTIDLENEFQTLMTPFHLNTIKVEVDPIERLMKLWIVKHGIQRTFRLPQTININQVRVHLLKDSKKVFIVAPRMCRHECFTGEELEREIMIMREECEEECCYEQEKLWEMIGEEKLMKMEGSMYNWMQNIRCQLPKFISLRGIRRHKLSGELALCLELINEQNEMNVVVLNKLTRKLMIDEAGVICGRHEIQLPTCINQEAIRWIKFNRYNNTIMQLQLPIVNNCNKFLNRMF